MIVLVLDLDLDIAGFGGGDDCERTRILDMDLSHLTRECSVLESGEDNEVAQHRIPHDDGREIKNNGTYPNDVGKFVSTENSGANTSMGEDTKEEVVQSAEGGTSPPPNATSPGGSSPGGRKRYGLKKWRRIKRESVSYASARVHTSKILKRGLSGSGNPTKAQYLPLEIKQNSEGSVGSANLLTTIGFADGFVKQSSLDSSLAVSAFAVGADSENSGDRTSKSLTETGPKGRYDLGCVQEKNRTKNVGGKILGNSAQEVHQAKQWTEGSKKPRGERVKLEKEDSLSSMESDSRSSNVVFMQGAFNATSNGKQTGRSVDYDGENSDEAHTSEEQFSEEVHTGYNEENVGEFKDLSLDDLAENLSWQVKEEKSENHQPSTDRDPLVDSLFSLQSVQEALEKEVHKLKDIGKEPTSPHDRSTTGRCMPADFTTTDSETYMPSSPDRLGSVKIRQTALTSLESQVLSLMKDLRFLESKLEETGAMLEAKDLRIVELEATISRSKSPREESSTSIGIQDEKCRETEIELESLFKQKIEAEVEHLAIIRTVQKMKDAAAEQVSKEHSFVAGKQAQVQNKLGEAQSKAMMLEKQPEVETYCGDRVGAKEVLKLQRACKLTSCFLIQLIFLVMVVWYFVLQSSPPPGGVVVVVVPT
ncbi:WPP domain-interacting protein 2-like [Carya illinoinensis]|uniref:WPP domain-interacting protein 2 n=1 Tax=Carya illinoinensis TaxID=32201 RepID=A0A8T1NZM7_CARIL|nr:WPP domain-interacting protein 2-like [Carya illinoinensis]KAG6634814.1 hypothetical protein CIPAW_12G142700 [Carya illinoinensis]KAG6686027.1 hypothetical protein I3842_12G141200 [Carya illinoinensis]